MLQVRCASAVLAATLLTAGLPALAQTAGPAVPVQTAPATKQDVPVLLRNIGTVQANQTVLVRSRVDGTLDKILFREGQDVKAGDALAIIDPRPYHLVLDQAEARKAADQTMLANAERDLARTANLARSDFASRQQLDTQQAAVAQLKANISGDEALAAAARLNIEYSHIVSPIDGRVGLRLVDAGNQVRASDGQAIVSVAQIHPIAAIFTLPQDTLPQIQTAMASGQLPVSAYAADDRTLLSTGTLLTIDNAIDAATGTIKLKAEFANADNRLWPGQFVNVRLQLGTLKDAVTVPSAAVQRGAAGLYVFIARPDGTAAVQKVEMRQDDGQTAVIASGIAAGDDVVVNGQSRLQNGSKITAAPAKAGS
jgi:multidrug efflux system membrane fusion protein